MIDREKVDACFAKLPVVNSEPREGLFRHIHPHRLRLRGVFMEAKVFLKARVRNDKPKPFLIYGRPRSGTTLLVDLLNQIPGIRCDGELLHDFVLRPTGFLRDLPKRSGAEVQAYGVKILSYQLMDVQRVVRPIAFFDRLSGMDYEFIFVTRNTWDQNLSLVKAQETGLYFGEYSEDSDLKIDPERFVAMLKWNMAMLEYEKKVMSHFDHLEVNYDSDLKHKHRRAQKINQICDVIGVSSDGEYEPNVKPTGGKSGSRKIGNMDDILNRVRREGLGKLIPENL